MYRYWLVLILLLVGFLSSVAQSTQMGGWYMYFANAKINQSPFAIHFEVQDRHHELASDLDQLLLRAGLQYQYNSALKFTGGYGYILSEAIDKPDVPIRENRIYQDIQLSQHIERVSLQHRFRYEQRFIEGVDFKTRYRYQLALKVPIKEFEGKVKNIYANVYNELFLHGQKLKPSDAIFDRNRLYLGAGLKFSEGVAVQMGFMKQIFADYSQPKLMLSLHHDLNI